MGIYVGLDFGNEYVQLSCINSKTLQPESVCVMPGTSRFRIPSVLYAKPETNEWLFGEDAYRYRGTKEGGYVDGLLEKALRKEETIVYGKAFAAEILLEKFLKKLLSVVKQRYGNDRITKLVIALKEPGTNMNEALLTALGALGIMEDRVKIIDYVHSFMYYIVCQNKEFRNHDAALFQYDKENLFFYRLSFGKTNKPMAVVAEKIDISKDFVFPLPEALLQQEQLARNLQRISEPILQKQAISVIYVTGSGFNTNWADEVMKGWCTGRRVFRGQNLYTKGACYAASLLAEGLDKDYRFFDHNMVRSSVRLKVYHDSVEEELKMIEAGTHWKEAESTVSVILDRTDALGFVIYGSLQKELWNADLSLDGYIKRENKTTRLSVSIRFLDREKMVVTVRDLGFGVFYPTNYRIWEHIFCV